MSANKALNDMIEVVAFEKGMPIDLVRKAMESAIAGLARKENKTPEGEYVARIDSNGAVSVERVWTYTDNVLKPDAQLSIENTAFEVGHTVKQPVSVPKWTRQGLQTVKQILAQKLKQGLREVVADQWQDKVGQTVIGVVKKADRERVYVDFGGNVEGVIEGRDRIPGERLRAGGRVRCYVKSVAADGRGSVIHLSRASAELLRELVEIEVPEVGNGQIKIKGIAREAGSRSKILVENTGYHGRSSPAAICAGTRGTRAQSVSNELNGERIDFIEWSDSDAQLIVNAMAPAEIVNIVLDNDKKTARIGVDESNLSRAIGGRGQNVRLASKVTGWSIDVMSTDDLKKKRNDEDEMARVELMELLEVDRDMAELLVEEGFVSVEDIAMSPIVELVALDGIDEEIAAVLQDRAIEASELKKMVQDAEDKESSIDGIEGITEDDINLLAGQGVLSLQDLADIAVDEVEWHEEDDRLGGFILEARRKVGMI